MSTPDVHPLRYHKICRAAELTLHPDSARAVSTALMRVGVLPSNMGSRYLRDAIILYSDLRGKLEEIYVVVAALHAVTPAAVERDIRAAIASAARRGWIGHINEVIGTVIIDPDEHICTKAFIAIMSEYFTVLARVFPASELPISAG